MSEAKVAKVWTSDNYDEWANRFRGTTRVNGSTVDYFESDEVERLFDAVRDQWQADHDDLTAKLDAAQQRIAELLGECVEYARSYGIGDEDAYLREYKQLTGRDYDEREGDE